MRVSAALWMIWYAYWIVSARKRLRSTEESDVKRESVTSRLGYMALLVVGSALLFWRPGALSPDRRLWAQTLGSLTLGLTVQALGLAFAIWARLTLGKNWSGRIAIGGSQELVIKGPYRLVRHPIYTGLLLAILGTAVVEGQVRAFVGALLVFAGVAIKLRREEAALQEHFGKAYEEYAKQVPGVAPRLR